MIHLLYHPATTPNNSRTTVLRIKPVNSSDVKVVRECFPLWERDAVGSVVRVQGADTTFELGATNMLVLSNTMLQKAMVRRLHSSSLHSPLKYFKAGFSKTYLLHHMHTR